MTNPVGGFTKQVRPTVTVSGGAYSSGDVVGGALELVAAVRRQGAAAILQELLVTDVSEQDAAFEVLIFDSEPDQTYTDNAACPTLAGDISKLVAKVTVAAGDYVSTGGLAINDITGIGRPCKALKGGTSLWAVLVTGSTPTYASTDDLGLAFKFLQD